jgi:uncharacterized protein (DUF2336 family)
LLSNFDLLEIIAGGAETGKLIALSRRRGLDEPVVDAVVATKDEDAVAAILENDAADISEETFDLIAFDAEEIDAWHAPMVNRENLPLRTIKRIEAGDLAAAEAKAEGPAPDERALAMFESGLLNQTALIEAVEGGELAFARHALILLSELEPPAVAKMLESRSGKAVAALAWKSGPDMEASEIIQKKLANVPSKDLLFGEDGGYPLPERDLEWYVAYCAE